MTEREKLIQELSRKERFNFQEEGIIENLADFILQDRKNICAPLSEEEFNYYHGPAARADNWIQLYQAREQVLELAFGKE